MSVRETILWQPFGKQEAMNIFRQGSMTWKNVIIAAVVSAAVVAALNVIPAFENTSFIAPATTMEVWVVLALYILINCGSWKEAALKTFVFFLVSQPLIYLLEVPFVADGFGIFRFYPYWFAWTVAAAPIAAMAYRIKKDDILSALVLSLANLCIVVNGSYWLPFLEQHFPNYSLAVAFSLITPFVLIFMLLKQRKTRIVATAVTAAVVVAVMCFWLFLSPTGSAGFPVAEEGNWHLAEPAPAGLNVSVTDNYASVDSRANGSYTLTFESDDGRTQTFTVEVGGLDHKVSVLTPDGWL